ncbi:MAG: serine/threonine protein kinase, partial [Nocardioides sp.]|nr:serine/threonine protein kinase [Nocardioides sp.]
MAERNEILNRRAYADARHRYRLDERIATGGMGEVWRATDTVLDREVAVKLLKREYADDSVFRARLETEAQHAAGLRHPGVAQVFDFGSGDPNGDGLPPYLVMEYVDGRPLSALLRPGSPMQPAAAVSLLAAVGDALGAAHAQGIVHRDVKPANILVTDDRQVRITDFGIARAADDVSLTRTGEVVGTPQYISPEQAEGKPATPASDVYALGAVGFECLAGHRPFVAETPVATALAHLRDPVPDLPDTVPPALAAVIRRSLAKDPGDRYADGAAVASALRAADAGSPAPEAALAAASTQVLPAGADAGA